MTGLEYLKLSPSLVAFKTVKLTSVPTSNPRSIDFKGEGTRFVFINFTLWDHQEQYSA